MKIQLRNKTKPMPRFSALLLFALLAACSTSRPPALVAVTTPGHYKESGVDEASTWAPAVAADGSDRGRWWTIFNDPELAGLIDQATADSPSLAAAAARVREAQAEAGIVDSNRGVKLGAGFGPTQTGGANLHTTTEWVAAFTPSYEVDLVGRLADSSRAAKLDASAEAAAYHTVLLSLQSDIARQYFTLRDQDSELSLLDSTVTLRQDALTLVNHRYQEGDTSELDVAQAKTELADVQAEAVALSRSRAQNDHALAVLLGKAPSAFSLSDQPLDYRPVTVPVGLPSELLERRPDIVRAQRQLAAASSRIGAAKGAFFPSLVLTGTGGFESNQLHNLFQWSSRAWMLGPLYGTILNLPILDGGLNRSVLANADAKYDESVANYQAQVLIGFQDVEDSLVAIRTLDVQLGFENDAAKSAKRAADLADARYKNGSTSYLEVIDAERSSLAAQRSAVEVAGLRELASVALVKALGGGWTAPLDVGIMTTADKLAHS